MRESGDTARVWRPELLSLGTERQASRAGGLEGAEGAPMVGRRSRASHCSARTLAISGIIPVCFASVAGGQATEPCRSQIPPYLGRMPVDRCILPQ